MKMQNYAIFGVIRISLIICSSLLLFLSSCSITSLPHDVRDSINNTESGINNANTKLDHAQTTKNQMFIEHTNVGYFGHQAIIQNDTDFLPPIFSNQIQLDQQFYGLRSVATSLTDLTRIPTMLDVSNSSNSEDCSGVRLTQQHGSLIDLLNLIGSRCDLGWTYLDGKLVLSDVTTKTWPILGIPGDVQVQNQINNNTGVQSQSGTGGSIGSGGSGGGGGGQSQSSSNQSTVQNIAFNLQNSLWQNLDTGLRAILSRSGKMSISPATSSITITDRPSVLLRADRYIKNQNDILKREVQVDIEVLNVDVSAEDNYGINWGVILAGQNAQFQINGQAVAAANGSGSASSFVPTQVFVPTNTTQGFTVTANSGDLSGSKLIISALSSVAKTSLVTSTAVSTLSNQPVPVQFVDQLAYVASVENTVSAGSGGFSQTALTPGQVTTGFSLNILPVIQTDHKINLQLSLNLSSLKKMTTFTSNQSSLQLPETMQRNFMQKVVLNSGDTFVVTGFDSDLGELTNTGVGSTSNWLLGGGVSASRTRTRMVVLVTPHVVNM